MKERKDLVTMKGNALTLVGEEICVGEAARDLGAVDKGEVIRHLELVKELAEEPNCESALKAAKKLM